MEPERRALKRPSVTIPWHTWRPALLDALAAYDKRAFAADLVAGITVGVVALPLAMAFGIASGVTPQAGIYTAIVGGFLVSLLGGSRIQIGGPTGAFVVIVAGIIAAHGLPGLLMVTMMAGVILLFLAVTGLGQAIKFIPRPVVLGFTNGIALLIASTQIKDFLGLQIAESPSEFFARMAVLGASLDTVKSGGRAAGVDFARAHRLDPAMVSAHPGFHRGVDRRDGRSGRLRSAGGDHRLGVRRYSKRAATRACAHAAR